MDEFMDQDQDLIDQPVDQGMDPGMDQEDAQAQEIMSIMAQLEARHAMTNIATELTPDQVAALATRVVDDFNTDEDSRAAWLSSHKDIMDLARLALQKKTYLGETVANVKYPIIISAAIQFAARAYPEIIKGTEVVKPKIVGKDPDGQKAARGKRVCDHMSYQLLNEMADWEDGVDQLLFTLPVVGCAFKKTYRSGVNNQNVSEMVFPEDLVVHYKTQSLEKASRITHIIELTKNEIIERIRSGVYLDFDVEELGLPSNAEADTDTVDADTPHRFLEQHRWYDLDDDGYQEPYIATVHHATQKLVRLSARYELAGVQENDKGQIVRIEPVHYFTRFLLMPSPDGSFYGMGFGSLLHSINASVNTLLNQLLDAGTINNRQSGFLGAGLRLGKGASLKLRSDEWKPVPATGDDLRKNIFPMPTKEPSSVLFQLLGLLIDTGKELSGITDVLSGQSPGSNVPAETTLALIEQGLQTYSAIHKRIHRSLYHEFQKIRRLNVMYLTDDEYLAVIDDQNGSVQDYSATDHDIIPVSDPAATTGMQRIMKAKALLEIRGQGLDDTEVLKRYLSALEIEDIDGLFPKEQQQDPLTELEIISKQAEIEKVVAEQGKIAAETQLVVEKIQSEKVTQEVQLRGTTFDQKKLQLEEATTINNIKSTEKRNSLDTAKLIHEIKTGNSKLEGKTSETSTQGPYREKGMKSNNKDLE